MDSIDCIIKELHQKANAEKAALLMRYFKTQEGGYGQGDHFIGITVPQIRKIAKAHYQAIEVNNIEMLLQNSIHEYRLTALIILVLKYEKAKAIAEKEAIIKVYLANLSFVNNWDLVDTSAPYLLGAFLYQQPKDLLYELAQTPNLWKQRMAIIATYYFIKQRQYQDTLAIAKILLHHRHDLIHKAVGWMLREIGNRDFDVAFQFIKEHHQTMPRTMLRYAIEKFPPTLRLQILKGQL